MSDYKAYTDCTLCKGEGEHYSDCEWGFGLIACTACDERYIKELRELLYEVLACEIPNGVAEKITPLLRYRPPTPQERLDNAYRLAEEK